jgi:hypothetical protein
LNIIVAASDHNLRRLVDFIDRRLRERGSSRRRPDDFRTNDDDETERIISSPSTSPRDADRS